MYGSMGHRPLRRRCPNGNLTVTINQCHFHVSLLQSALLPKGFIKIDTNSLGDSTDSYLEVLDGTRVHPETYEWARKMAVDALEYDDTSEDANPAAAVEEILESPERLKDLDLDAFAAELERQVTVTNMQAALYSSFSSFYRHVFVFWVSQRDDVSDRS